MKKYIIELPSDFESMTEHEQDMNIELAYRKRKEAIDISNGSYKFGIIKLDMDLLEGPPIYTLANIYAVEGKI